MFLKKVNYIINRLLVIVPLLIITLPFLNGLGCNARVKGQTTQPLRDVEMICVNGVYDMFNYFPDGSVRHHTGLFGYFMGTAVFVSLSYEYINLNLSDNKLKIDIVNQSDKFFKLNLRKVNEENLNVSYLYDSTDADTKVSFKALYHGEFGFIE